MSMKLFLLLKVKEPHLNTLFGFEMFSNLNWAHAFFFFLIALYCIPHRKIWYFMKPENISALKKLSVCDKGSKGQTTRTAVAICTGL